MDYDDLKLELITVAQLFNKTGLSVSTSGNLSVRIDEGYLITPTGIVYDDLQVDDIVQMDLYGKQTGGKLKPSSEWRFHRGIYTARSEIKAIVHVHSPYATSIACLRQDIPAFHYMVAIAGGDNIPCADYATFGTDELAKNVVQALENRKACLLANHGMISLGGNIKAAYKLGQEVESLAQQYWLCKQLGNPVILDDAEMKINLEKFGTYGKQDDE